MLSTVPLPTISLFQTYIYLLLCVLFPGIFYMIKNLSAMIIANRFLFHKTDLEHSCTAIHELVP